VNALDNAVAAFCIPVTNPKLWSVDEPNLYTLRTTVKKDGVVTDEVTTHCGFRTIRFDADKGFFLNDQPLKIKGTCNHIDHAGVGVAVPDALWEFRLRKLKEMGSNAVRCSHNPPSAEFLDACDRLGMLVMDENRNFNPAPEYMEQLDWMVQRDRNHPSIILWSVFNEEPMQSTEQGYEMVRRMSAAVKKLDTTRPVTAAMSGGQFTPLNVSHAVDVVGFNYSAGGYDHFHQLHPTHPMTSSEDTSAVMTRGEYVTDKSRNILDSYDDEHPGWGSTHRDAWKAIATRPFIAGGFVWTGFDYRGEPTPFGWPSAGSFFGCMDLCGFPKTAFYLHQALWIENKPVLTLAPHWNWAGREGKPVKVMALTNAQRVELILNGKSLGEKPVDKYEMVSWEVPYEAGKLEAIGKNDGKKVSHFEVETTGEPTMLDLIPDRKSMAGDGWDAMPVTVRVLDARGRAVPTANTPVDFETSGPGTIIGLGNGDPNCHEPEKGNRHSLFNGLAQVILQSKAGGSGPLILRAKADGVKTAELRIDVAAAESPAAVPAVKPSLSLEKWRMSPVTAVKPDPNQQLAENDQNSWANVHPGVEQQYAEGSYAIYLTKFKAYAGQQKDGGRIHFKGITGKAEIWLDKKLAGTKETPGKAELIVPLPPGDSEHTLSVLVESEQGKHGGLTGLVTVEAAVGD
jgi:beta-galactosidase